MSDEKRQLIELYNNYKTRCLSFGEEPLDIQVDNFKYRVDDKNNVLLTDWLDTCYYSSIDIELPDYFDGIESIKSFTTIRSLILNDSAKFLLPHSLKHLRIRYIDLNNVERIETSAISFTTLKEIKAEKLRYIEDSALSYNNNLTELYLPNVVLCSDFSFCSCKNLEKVVFNKLLLFYTNTFHLCDKLSYLDLGGEVREIPKEAFIGNSLEEIKGLDKVEKVGSRAFMYNNNLKELKLPNCEKIFDCAFKETSLNKIQLSDSLKFVGEEAFETNHPFYSRLLVDYLGNKKHFLYNVNVKKSNEYLKWAKVRKIEESEV